MSNKMTIRAYDTILGNNAAKSILALLADFCDEDGYGWPSIYKLHKRIELDSRTVRRHIQVFTQIGLLERKERHDERTGKRLNDAFQFSLEKLGTDLSKEFAAALKKAGAKAALASPDEGVSPATHVVVSSDRNGVVSSDREGCLQRPEGLSPATAPPHPLIGGTVIEPLKNPSNAGAQQTPSTKALPKSLGTGGELMCATWLFEELGIAAAGYDVQMLAKVIAYAARDAGCEMQDATNALVNSAREAMARGEIVNTFWFRDRKFAAKGASDGTSGPSKSKQRIDNNRRALAEALAKRGVRGPWSADGGDDAPLAGTGSGELDGRVHGGHGVSNDAVRDRAGAVGGDGIAHFARPEILPAAR
jgi:DNA-binding transcriptional ArsR family regulator